MQQDCYRLISSSYSHPPASKVIIIYHMIYTTNLSVWSQYIFVLCSSPSSVFSFLAFFFPFLSPAIPPPFDFHNPFLSVFSICLPPFSSSFLVFQLCILSLSSSSYLPSIFLPVPYFLPPSRLFSFFLPTTLSFALPKDFLYFTFALWHV